MALSNTFNRFFHQRRTFSSYVVMVLLILLSTSCVLFLSDEQILRIEFGIPSSVDLVSINASGNSGWGTREGLDITATFKFTPTEFREYREEAEKEDGWQSLPMKREFIIKMTGVRSYLEALHNSYTLHGDPLPPLGSVRNPTEEQVYKRWLKRLPLDVKSGLYQCKTAGNDIMNSLKVSCSSKSGDLNDFMFAVLDFEHQTMRVQVHASY